MFTGIIRAGGTITAKTPTSLTISINRAFGRTLKRGDSIAVNGVCLTVTHRPSASTFTADVMPETLKRTTLGHLALKTLVNLERPATPTTFLDGHIVQGHIDCTARVESIVHVGNSRIITFRLPKTWMKYIVEKGSVAINGVSLTIINVKKGVLTVGIIPHTWNNTTFNTLAIGDDVNIETDIIAKHLYHLSQSYA